MSEKAMETKVSEIKDDKGNVIERITETWVEKVPMELVNRKVEKITYPVVVDEYNEVFQDGNLVKSEGEKCSKVDMSKDFHDLKNGMKNRVENSNKKVDYMLYAVIALLVAEILYTLFTK